ncbi:DUF445 domain-containing protein [Sediminibacterium soli]|uniref:DUF445 domain-containing protein n=1 Tax=Sediminibacterium soli TaxID=2698829 RepID=UPI00137A8B40|nr:DUF445 family protein [Sediminibacterium soli]NCI46942.1 DUF445 family protein [Sediminibacterium soli]
MAYNWVLVPLISACIGWLANRMAVWLLFHPRKPIMIFGFTLQGIFPGRQQSLAAKLGRLVADELFSFDELGKKIAEPGNAAGIIPQAEAHIDHFLKVKLAEKMPMISMFIGEKTIAELKSVFMTELQELFPVIMSGYIANLKDQLDLEKIVREKINGYSSEQLERRLNETLSRELRLLPLGGAVLGLLIGLIQVAVMGIWF